MDNPELVPLRILSKWAIQDGKAAAESSETEDKFSLAGLLSYKGFPDYPYRSSRICWAAWRPPSIDIQPANQLRERNGGKLKNILFIC